MNIHHGVNSLHRALYVAFIAPVIRIHQVRHASYAARTMLRLDLERAQLKRPTELPYNNEITSKSILLRPEVPIPGAKPTVRALKTLFRAIQAANNQFKSKEDEVLLVQLSPPKPQERRPPLCALMTVRELLAKEQHDSRVQKNQALKTKKQKDLDINWTTSDHHLTYAIARLHEFLRDGHPVTLNFVAPRRQQPITMERAEEVIDTVKASISELKKEGLTNVVVNTTGEPTKIMSMQFTLSSMSASRSRADKKIKVTVPCSQAALEAELAQLRAYLKKLLNVQVTFTASDKTSKSLLSREEILKRIRTVGRSAKDSIEDSDADDTESMNWVVKGTKKSQYTRIVEVEPVVKKSLTAVRAEWVAETAVDQRPVFVYVPDEAVEKSKDNTELYKMMDLAEGAAKYPLICEYQEELEKSYAHMVDTEHGVLYKVALATVSNTPIGSHSHPPLPAIQASRLNIPQEELHEPQTNSEGKSSTPTTSLALAFSELKKLDPHMKYLEKSAKVETPPPKKQIETPENLPDKPEDWPENFPFPGQASQTAAPPPASTVPKDWPANFPAPKSATPSKSRPSAASSSSVPSARRSTEWQQKVPGTGPQRQQQAKTNSNPFAAQRQASSRSLGGFDGQGHEPVEVDAQIIRRPLVGRSGA
jgi:translation initiation factor IF-3